MGLLRRHLYLLATEHQTYPVAGNVLTLGQQSVHATLDDVILLFKTQGLVPLDLPIGFDTKNKIPDWKGTRHDNYTNCQAVLRLLGSEKVLAADVSEYENPDIIMNFNRPADPKYHGAFDAILDVGTLEHIFNISQALKNISLMLKPGGTVILGTWTSGAINHGFYQICPTLFYDYFSNNGFEDFTCFMLVGSSINYQKKAKIYRCNLAAMKNDIIFNSKTGVETMFFARKKASWSNNDIKEYPIQSYYLDSHYWNKHLAPKTRSSVKKLLLWLVFATRKYRPEFIDMIWKSMKTKKNLTYIGKY